MLCVLEGNEGCGKTTQIKLLEKYFLDNGKRVYVTKEPGGSNIGIELREILLHSKEDISLLAELLLYMVDRAQHVEKVIKPKLNEGYVVLCDRYTDSTVAYQAYGRGLDLTMINNLNKLSSFDLKADIYIYLDIDVKLGLERALKASNKYDRFESLDLEFHIRVRDAYRIQYEEKFKKHKAYFLKVDNLSIEEVHQNIIDYIKEI